MIRWILSLLVAIGWAGGLAVSAIASYPVTVSPPSDAYNPYGQRRFVPSGGSIQTVINQCAAGDTVVVAPGSYDEEVTIPVTLTNLTLIGAGNRGAAYIAPASGNSGRGSLTSSAGARRSGARSATVASSAR